MLVREYMTTTVTTVKDDATLLDAALLVRQTGKRHVPVVSAATGAPVGIVSDRDIARLGPSDLMADDEEQYNQIFGQTPIVSVMTKNPLSVAPDAPILQAVQLMHSMKIGAVLVVEENSLKGILSVSDMLSLLMDMLTTDQPLSAAAF